MPLLPPPLLPAAGTAADSMPKIMAQKIISQKMRSIS
jgi:hypothetical protein